MQWSYRELQRLTSNGFLGREICDNGRWGYFPGCTLSTVPASTPHVPGSTTLGRFEWKMPCVAKPRYRYPTTVSQQREDLRVT
jgi:hypothetical protein